MDKAAALPIPQTEFRDRTVPCALFCVPVAELSIGHAIHWRPGFSRIPPPLPSDCPAALSLCCENREIFRSEWPSLPFFDFSGRFPGRFDEKFPQSSPDFSLLHSNYPIYSLFLNSSKTAALAGGKSGTEESAARWRRLKTTIHRSGYFGVWFQAQCGSPLPTFSLLWHSACRTATISP